MALKTIFSTKFNEYSQEENIEKQLIAGSDGIVTEVEVVYQQYFHTWMEFVVLQEEFPDENRSRLYFETYACFEIGEKGNQPIFNISTSQVYLKLIEDQQVFRCVQYGVSDNDGKEIPKGQTVKFKIINCNTDYKFDQISGGYGTKFNYGVALVHKLDGSRALSGYTNASYSVTNIIGGKWETNPESKQIFKSEDISFDLSFYIDRGAKPITANNFTDEENPSFSFTTTPPAFVYPYFNSLNLTTFKQHYANTSLYKKDSVISIQASLSFDGVNPVIAYRDVSLDATSYTITLTEAERNILRQNTQGSTNKPIYYLTKTIRAYENEETATIIDNAQRVLTIVGCKPTLNPTVKDVNSDTIALTGNANRFVRYESMVEFTTGATASKHATIVSQSVQCGSKTVNNLYNGVIDNIESGSFIFNASDSRGLHADQVVVTNTTMVEYIKPTCKQELEIGISGETGATVTLKASGSYFNGSFGAVNNTFTFQVRYGISGGTMGGWTTIAISPTFNGNSYELTTTFGGLSYEESYIFQSRLIDKLNTVETSQYTTKLVPVFDWGETDFNFNVPVNINAENIDMYGETVLRHNKTAKNTILSSNGGNIYFRPNGTDDTSNETIFYGNGNIKLGGAVDFSSFTINGNTLADYVIATGSASMGSNGTWYWQKWASGKAEAWGCRNFGNMAVTTAWGNLYRSEIFTQNLPSGVFVRTPDSININIVHGGYGGWICKHEQTAPSAVTTGSFIYVRPASATLTPSNLGFHIIGEWK